MVVLSRTQVAQLIQDRHKAMADTRFKPENYHEIHRVLGVRFAPDLTRVVTKQRANVASAYLKRLQRDVERSKEGFYDQLQALPIQIKRMKIHTEDTRSFRSVLVPRFKLPTVAEDDSYRTRVSPKILSPSSVTPGVGLPPLSLPSGTGYVPHMSFSPHTNTHVHVLYKQVPGSVTPRKGAGSVVSNASSVQGTHSVADTKSRRSSLQCQPSTRPTPRDDLKSKNAEDSESESGSSEDSSPQPYSTFKTSTENTPLPQIKKKLFVNLMPLNEAPKAMAMQEHRPSVGSMPAGRVISRKGSQNIPPKVAAALAAGGSSSTALYKFVLPSTLGGSYNTSPIERPKAILMGSKNRLTLPSVAPKASAGGPLLAVTSVRPSLVQAAA